MQKISAFANGLNMPVIIGEYGAVNKENDFNRIIYLSALNRTAETYNIVTAYWIMVIQVNMDLPYLIEILIDY